MISARVAVVPMPPCSPFLPSSFRFRMVLVSGSFTYLAMDAMSAMRVPSVYGLGGVVSFSVTVQEIPVRVWPPSSSHGFPVGASSSFSSPAWPKVALKPASFNRLHTAVKLPSSMVKVLVLTSYRAGGRNCMAYRSTMAVYTLASSLVIFDTGASASCGMMPWWAVTFFSLNALERRV